MCAKLRQLFLDRAKYEHANCEDTAYAAGICKSKEVIFSLLTVTPVHLSVRRLIWSA